MTGDRCFPPGQQRPGNRYSHFTKLETCNEMRHRQPRKSLAEYALLEHPLVAQFSAFYRLFTVVMYVFHNAGPAWIDHELVRI